jgi:hypothetical protein
MRFEAQDFAETEQFPVTLGSHKIIVPHDGRKHKRVCDYRDAQQAPQCRAGMLTHKQCKKDDDRDRYADQPEKN